MHIVFKINYHFFNLFFSNIYFLYSTVKKFYMKHGAIWNISFNNLILFMIILVINFENFL